MALIAALIAGLIAGWAFARGRTARPARAAVAGMLGAGATAVVAALAGGEPFVGAALGIAAGALVARSGRSLPGEGLGASAEDSLLDTDYAWRAASGQLPLLLVALLLLRLGLVLANGLPLTPDEAQYWDWSRTPDLAFYSKPGGLAWLIGGWTAVAGDSLLALRSLGLALAVAVIALIWPAARAASGRRDIAWLATILAALLPIHACTAGLLTTDALLLLCWAGFLAVLLRTPAAGGRPGWWHAPALGVLLAAGLAAKYAMLYAPLAILAAAPALPQLRAWLRSSTTWLIAVIGAAGLLPTLLWNDRHDWVGLAHVAAQCGAGKGWSLTPGHLAAFVASQAAVALPVALVLPWSVRWAWQQRSTRPAAWLLATAAATPLLLLLLTSLHTKVQANWAAMAWIPAAILTAWWLIEAASANSRRVVAGGAVLTLLAAVLVAAVPAIRFRFPDLPPSVPERKLAGWDELAEAVSRVLAVHAERTVILTTGYDAAAELAWHGRRLPRPLCANFGRRMNQYDLWGGLDGRHRGWDAVFAMELDRTDALAGDLLDRLPAGLRGDFAATGTPQLVRIEHGGRTWRTFLVVRLSGFDGVLDSARPVSAW